MCVDDANKRTVAFVYFVDGFRSHLDGAILVWSLVELGVSRGAAGANQYGEDPLLPSER
jgi:uncharacterized membrane protein YhaH (DUF805 family)